MAFAPISNHHCCRCTSKLSSYCHVRPCARYTLVLLVCWRRFHRIARQKRALFTWCALLELKMFSGPFTPIPLHIAWWIPREHFSVQLDLTRLKKLSNVYIRRRRSPYDWCSVYTRVTRMYTCFVSSISWTKETTGLNETLLQLRITKNVSWQDFVWIDDMDHIFFFSRRIQPIHDVLFGKSSKGPWRSITFRWSLMMVPEGLHHEFKKRRL